MPSHVWWYHCEHYSQSSPFSLALNHLVALPTFCFFIVSCVVARGVRHVARGVRHVARGVRHVARGVRHVAVVKVGIS